MNVRLMTLMESRIHGDVYVRFGGEYSETCRLKERQGAGYLAYKQYRKSGWLLSLSKGVMYRMGDKLLAFPALACYNSQLEKIFHIAAHSALELYGFNHYVPMGKPVLIVGHPKSQAVPECLVLK